ncbi:hypothetical protein D6825_03415 [Candidatus Woesearchaeota archaeon]|nr:MAG: hypothetical protein D6825_03415 [Candidatus Woesearchaeota archaeon]
MEKITFEKKLEEKELIELIKNITFRGLYNESGEPLKPYKGAKFSLVRVNPPKYPTSFPEIMHIQPQPLFTAQPTIYKSQIDVLSEVDNFLKTIGKRIHTLGFEGIQYWWEGRGRFHVLPPIIEKHTYPLKNGFFDLAKIAERFKGTYVKDAKGNLHELSNITIRDYYVDGESKIKYLDIFNPNANLINYGLRFTGNSDFYIICDGSHRMDYALEHMDKPINAILVESENLLPYYALPMPFRPTTRLSSKHAEKIYPKLERDKIHLLNDFLKKVLHYNWEKGGLHVSKLRSNAKIH